MSTLAKSIGPINSIVLSRSAGTDNVYIRDEDSIEANGLCELKISDNQIMNFNDRSDYLPELLQQLNGLEYYINDYNSTGILYLELCDRYNVHVNGTDYSCVMFNDEINITTGIEEIIHTEKPEQGETDYSKADKTDRRINQTYIIVDKQNQIIESVVTNVTDQNDKISKITQTVDEINSKISDIADITIAGESSYAYVQLDEINKSEPIMIKVHPILENISYLYPNTGLFPNSDVYLKTRLIRFRRTYIEDGETKTEDIDYELPDNLLWYDNNTYDEFYLDYDSKTCEITKRCGYNADGTVYKLDKEIITAYPYPEIVLEDGDYEILLLNYTTGYINVRLMAKNIYTSQFATKAEVSSSIQQSSTAIISNVNTKLESYPTRTEMNSTISQTAQEINLEVSKKVGEDEIISRINQSAEQIQIEADKISLDGKIVDLTADNIRIASTNFSVDKNGHMFCNNAHISGNITIGGEKTNPQFLATDGRYRTYIYPLGLFNEVDGKFASLEKAGLGVGTYSGTSITETGKFTTDSFMHQATYNRTSSGSSNLRIDSAGYIYRATGSSKRWKKDITEDIEDRLNPQKLYKLPIKQFKYKDSYLNKNDKRYGKNILGFIAEDVKEIYEPAVEYDEDGQVEMWNSDVMIPAMMKLIQEQHTEIQKLQEEMKKIKEEKENGIQ